MEGTRQIVLANRAGARFRVMNEHLPECLPLRYPGLYPHGELGWRINFPRHHADYAPAVLLPLEEDEDGNELDQDLAEFRHGRNRSTRVFQQQ